MTVLEGIRVLDLTRASPGPYCSMVLADFGADVIKVQEPVSPEGRRAEQAGGTGTSFLDRVNHLDRNKRSIVLNLKTEEGKAILFQMVKNADVVIEQWRPGTAKRLGVDFDTLKAVNNRLIYCAITGYGQTGPYKDLVGHDANYIAFSGLLGVIGNTKGSSPVIPLNIGADYAGGGIFALVGILLALLARQRTGRGQYVDMSMTDGVVYMLARYFAEYFAGTFPAQRGYYAFPHYGVYKTKDNKYITICAAEPWFWGNLCRALGCEDFIPYQLATGSKRREIFIFFRQAFRSKTRDEWFDILSKKDVPVGMVQSFDEVIEHPHFQQRKMFVELKHPQGGKVKQVGIGIKLSDTPGSVRGFVPKRGQHTNELLKEMGYREGEIATLHRKGCVG